VAMGVRRWPLSWALLSLVVVAMLLGAGWLGAMSHKGEARALAWQDLPVHDWFEDSWTVEAGLVRAGGSVTGYDTDDSQLGGSVEENHDVAFKAITERLTYWRGEAKTVYTGKGWIEYESPGLPFTGLDALEGTVFEQEILLDNPSLGSVIFAGGRVASIERLDTVNGNRIPLDQVRSNQDSSKVFLASGLHAASYRLRVTEQPEKMLDAMAEKVNLQLPVDYDPRVGKLAAEVTEGAVTSKQKAEAIAAFLSTEYLYRLDAREVPAGKDFVAHFLFDTKEGYCDHFSSALVVMLRSVGVPARWAKGFSTGEITQAAEGDAPRYEVTVRNSDAHSWAEVFLPDTGWTLFEPTPGFADDAISQGIVDAKYEAAVDRSEPGNRNTASVSHTAGPLVVIGRLILDESRSIDTALLWERLKEKGRSPLGIGVAASFLYILVISVVMKQLRLRKRKPEEDRKRIRSGGEDAYAKLLQGCWDKIYRKFGPKPSGQTLREYVNGLPLEANRKQAILELLGWHERYVFGGERLRRMSAKQLDFLWRQIKGS
jgi:transglutaminase-like putative cysteine protease